MSAPGGYVLACVVFACGASVAAAPLPLSSVPVPGTTAALARAAGITQPVARWRVLREVVRVTRSSTPEADRRAAALSSYLSVIRTYESLLSAVDGEGRVAVAAAQDRAHRGALDRLLAFVGLRLRAPDGGDRFMRLSSQDVTLRRKILADAGLDLRAMERALQDESPFAASLPSDTVPLPLPTAAWAPVLGGPVPARELVAAILLDPRAALLYHGLLALDAPTAAYLAAAPDLLDRLHEHAAIFAALSDGWRIADGRVLVPGGTAADSAWQALVGEAPTSPDSFSERLFSRDDGALAYFFDALAHLDGPRLAFALSLREAAPQRRLDRILALYAAARPVLDARRVAFRAFDRPVADAADVLRRVEVESGGRLVGPPWMKLWNRVFDSSNVPDGPVDWGGSLEADGEIDAARLVHLVCVTDPAVRRERLATFLFAQRLFPSPTVRSASNIPVVLKGRKQLPALGVTLERMGIADEGLHADAVRRAILLSSIRDAERAATALAEFQAALVIVERARFARTLGLETTTQLVRALVALPLTEEGEYAGHIARWCEADLLPALRRGVGDETLGPERLILAAMAGHRPGAATRRVTWEDVVYKVDPAAGELVRLDRLLRSQSGNGFDAVLGFARTAAALAGAATVEAARSGSGALAAAVHGVARPRRIGLPDSDAPPDPAEEVARLQTAIARLTAEKDASKIRESAFPLVRLADIMLADALATLAYLPALGDPEGPASLVHDISARHDFGLRILTVRDNRQRSPWELPVQQFPRAGGWHVKGSLLALDASLALLSLRKVASERMLVPPTILDNERQALSETVVFMNPWLLQDADRDAIATAIRRGLSRAAILSDHADDAAVIAAAAGLPQWRANALSWLLTEEPAEANDFLSHSELLRLGQEAAARVAPDAWGTSMRDWTASFILRFPDGQPWERFEGRVGVACLAERLPDLALWVALNLADAGIPSQVARDVLAAVTQDWADEAQLLHADDWVSGVRYVRQLPHSRFDDYVAALTAAGPLVPDIQ